MATEQTVTNPLESEVMKDGSEEVPVAQESIPDWLKG